MTLDDLGNLGEIVAAIGVVVSLIYLGRQIRQNTAHLSQNTQSVQLSALEATVESGNRVRELLIVNPELSELYTKGLEGYSQLDRTERLRFGMLLTNLFGALQASYTRNVELIPNPRALEFMENNLDSILAHAGIREWWERRQADWQQEFREVVNEQLAHRSRGHGA